MANNRSVKSAGNVSTKFAILGTYEGECADANITNLNGLDITREVWENVFNSDDFKQAIELGWYIGFLGHPEDPNCMDFEHACIVMTDGYIDSNGKVHGKFNLIDTPVGRIVKSFQDAGVTFGISVRGAGDIIDNSVDPDTFVFRGFDLVTFPAFPESIPKFSEIAASTDLNKRAKYRQVCATVNANLNKITMCETLDVIKSQFASQSKEYKALAAREAEISNSCIEPDIKDVKVNSIMKLYLESVEANSRLVKQNKSLKQQLQKSKSDYRRKLQSIERITAAQQSDAQLENDSLKSRNKRLLSRISAANKLNSELTTEGEKLRKQVNSSDKKCNRYAANNDKLNSDVVALKDENLKYKQKIDAYDTEVRKKDSTISRLRSELDETVNAAERTKSRTSNLDAENKKLTKRIKAAEELIAEYQDAYASLYANALGVSLNDVPVTASTSVKDLQKLVGGTSAASLSNVFTEPAPVELAEDTEDEIVTI